MKSRSLWIVGIVALVAAAPAFARIDFTPLGVYDAVPFDMSDDGSKIVFTGYFGFPNIYWTADEGAVDLGGGCGAGQIAISGDGSTIVGCTQDENGNGQAGLWLGGQDWRLLGSEPGAVPCDASLSSPWDLNQNGTIAVGLLWRAQLCRAVAGTWDLATAPPAVSLGTTVPDRASRANSVNADGSVIAGWQDDEFGNRAAVKWVNGVQEPILTDQGEPNGEPLKINNPGTAIVGVNYAYGTQLGWLWRAGKGMISFGQGSITAQIQTVPTGVSDDGNTVIGFVRGPQKTRSFLWTDNKGFQWLDDVLKGQTAAGWQLTFLDAMTPDGRLITGYGINPSGQIEAFLIDLKASGKR